MINFTYTWRTIILTASNQRYFVKFINQLSVIRTESDMNGRYRYDLTYRYPTLVPLCVKLLLPHLTYDDFNSNWLFVQHVLSMDTTFHEPVLMQRAITNPIIQRYAFIAWEILTALFCRIGYIALLTTIKERNSHFNEAKKIAYIGLFFGFALYMLGFIIIGGEWFSMRQSSTWNGQEKAGLFISLIMFVMIFLANGDTEK